MKHQISRWYPWGVALGALYSLGRLSDSPGQLFRYELITFIAAPAIHFVVSWIADRYFPSKGHPVTLTCRRCTNEYEAFGGLLFGTPYRPAPHAQDDVAVKIHLCPECTQVVVDDITGHADRLARKGAT